MSAPLVVKRFGGGYAVFEGAKRLSGQCGSSGEAEARGARILQARAKERRNCLTCRKPFMSEGPHNRMCDVCRRSAARLGPQFTEPSDEPRLP